MVMLCIASFEAIGETSNGKIASVMCRSFQLQWTNVQTIPASKELSTFACRNCHSIIHTERRSQALLHGQKKSPVHTVYAQFPQDVWEFGNFCKICSVTH